MIKGEAIFHIKGKIASKNIVLNFILNKVLFILDAC